MEKNDIIKILKENNNCYVNSIDNINIKELEKIIGCKIETRATKTCDGGFVLEKKEN